MLKLGNSRGRIVEIKEVSGVLQANNMLKTGEWEIVWVCDRTQPLFVLGRRAIIVATAENMTLEVRTVASELAANELLHSGKWQLLDARVAQRSLIVDGKVVHNDGAVFILGCIKP